MELTDIVRSLSGSGGSGQAAGLGAVLSLLNSQGGGLGGLVQAFERQGLGDVISSWISTGPNLPISPDQVHQALGSSPISNFASQAGVPADAVGQMLATLLPSLIDRMTPNGQLPSSGALPGVDVLKQLLG